MLLTGDLNRGLRVGAGMTEEQFSCSDPQRVGYWRLHLRQVHH